MHALPIVLHKAKSLKVTQEDVGIAAGFFEFSTRSAIDTLDTILALGDKIFVSEDTIVDLLGKTWLDEDDIHPLL